jgi:hypothetical protein
VLMLGRRAREIPLSMSTGGGSRDFGFVLSVPDSHLDSVLVHSGPVLSGSVLSGPFTLRVFTACLPMTPKQLRV